MKRPQGRQAQKQATRARILEVARTHFEREGFAKANVRTIASDADVAVGTVLLHFSDKLGLLHAALAEDLDGVIDRTLRAPSRGLLLNRICGIVQSFYDYYALRPELSKILLRESLFAESPWKERFSEQVLRVSAHIIGLVGESKQKQEIDRAADAQLFAAAFLSYYYLALLGWVQGGMESPMPLFKALMADHIARLRAPQLADARGSKVQRSRSRD
jgi:AcrR family transcriptional regulator